MQRAFRSPIESCTFMRRVGLCVFCVALSEVLVAQQPNCQEVAAMARMAKAASGAQLTTWKQKAGVGYRARLVFSSRMFELHSDRRPAAALLDLIPQNEQQDSVWHTLGSFLCDAETFDDVKLLAKLQTRLPRDLARAVLLVPDKMFDYISYAYVSTQDPDSDYAVQMQSACRAKHGEFVAAVDRLLPEKRKWFVSKIFNPEGCHAIRLPEAE